MANLILPGNPRYQPEELVSFFGYDNLFRTFAQVEIEVMKTLGDLGVISEDDLKDLTPEVAQKIMDIPTAAVDKVEREITKHDVRAWVRITQEIIGPKLARWVHVPLTSYDALDTARILQFCLAYRLAIKPALKEFVKIFIGLVKKFAGTLQIARTHGQHALPITAGFWLATILSRVVCNWKKIDEFCDELTGKISGAVGAYNAQGGLNFPPNFEELVLAKLGLKPAKISTQILPPEPLAYFLFSCTMLSASLGQFGRDCRNLMRTEIGEISEPFEIGQVGSSTMPHKRNPINFENLEGMWIRNKNEFGKVMDVIISEHQRDLIGSSVARDFPIILVNLQTQLNNMLRKDKNNVPFLERISVNEEACQKNFEMSAKVILAEPLYIALQMAGYQKDAHKLVNNILVPIATREKIHLVSALSLWANKDEEIENVCDKIPQEVWELLHSPEDYTGRAQEKALEIADYAQNWINSFQPAE